MKIRDARERNTNRVITHFYCLFSINIKSHKLLFGWSRSRMNVVLVCLSCCCRWWLVLMLYGWVGTKIIVHICKTHTQSISISDFLQNIPACCASLIPFAILNERNATKRTTATSTGGCAGVPMVVGCCTRVRLLLCCLWRSEASGQRFAEQQKEDKRLRWIECEYVKNGDVLWWSAQKMYYIHDTYVTYVLGGRVNALLPCQFNNPKGRQWNRNHLLTSYFIFSGNCGDYARERERGDKREGRYWRGDNDEVCAWLLCCIEWAFGWWNNFKSGGSFYKTVFNAGLLLQPMTKENTIDHACYVT